MNINSNGSPGLSTVREGIRPSVLPSVAILKDGAPEEVIEGPVVPSSALRDAPPSPVPEENAGLTEASKQRRRSIGKKLRWNQVTHVQPFDSGDCAMSLKDSKGCFGTLSTCDPESEKSPTRSLTSNYNPKRPLRMPGSVPCKTPTERDGHGPRRKAPIVEGTIPDAGDGLWVNAFILGKDTASPDNRLESTAATAATGDPVPGTGVVSPAEERYDAAYYLAKRKGKQRAAEPSPLAASSLQKSTTNESTDETSPLFGGKPEPVLRIGNMLYQKKETSESTEHTNSRNSLFDCLPSWCDSCDPPSSREGYRAISGTSVQSQDCVRDPYPTSYSGSGNNFMGL